MVICHKYLVSIEVVVVVDAGALERVAVLLGVELGVGVDLGLRVAVRRAAVHPEEVQSSIFGTQTKQQIPESATSTWALRRRSAG